MEDKLTHFLNDTYKFQLTTQGKLKLSTGQIKIDKILAKISEPHILQKYDLIDFYLNCNTKEVTLGKVLDDINAQLVAKKHTDIAGGVPDEYLPTNITVGVDQTKKDIYILNKDFERLPVTSESWKEVFGHKLYADVSKIFCHMKYDPYTLKKVIDDTSIVKTINTCVHPSYRYQDTETPIALNPLFLEFFEGLFSTKDSLEYTCSWYWNTIHNRNETALVMVGAKAVGKNIFCSTFNRMLGNINVSNQANNAYTEKFNSFLKNKRVVIADEVSFKDGKEKNRVKKYFNKVQSIEEKGRDSETIEVFCSMVMLSNDVRDLFIEADDRRFSCVDLTDITLPQRMSPEDINKLREYIEYDQDFPIAFYQYLKANRYKDFVNALPFKGEIFDKLVLSSLSGVKTAILNYILEGSTGSFTLGQIDFDWDKEFPRRKPSFYYFEEFMTNFKYNGKSLGSITTARRTLDYIVNPNPELLVEKPRSEL